jgi:anti-anti-sigma regulatory factor
VVVGRLSVQVLFDKRGPTVALRGELDADTAPCLRTVLQSLVAREPRLTFDLSGLTRVDALGQEVLSACIADARVRSTVSVRGIERPPTALAGV